MSAACELSHVHFDTSLHVLLKAHQRLLSEQPLILGKDRRRVPFINQPMGLRMDGKMKRILEFIATDSKHLIL
jgi:hypothetical protein